MHACIRLCYCMSLVPTLSHLEIRVYWSVSTAANIRSSRATGHHCWTTRASPRSNQKLFKINNHQRTVAPQTVQKKTAYLINTAAILALVSAVFCIYNPASLLCLGPAITLISSVRIIHNKYTS